MMFSFSRLGMANHRLTDKLTMRSCFRWILFGVLVFTVVNFCINYTQKYENENELNVFKWTPREVRHDTARNLSAYKSTPIFDAYYKCVFPKLEPLNGQYNEVSFSLNCTVQKTHITEKLDNVSPCPERAVTLNEVGLRTREMSVACLLARVPIWVPIWTLIWPSENDQKKRRAQVLCSLF